MVDWSSSRVQYDRLCKTLCLVEPQTLSCCSVSLLAARKGRIVAGPGHAALFQNARKPFVDSVLVCTRHPHLARHWEGADGLRAEDDGVLNRRRLLLRGTACPAGVVAAPDRLVKWGSCKQGSAVLRVIRGVTCCRLTVLLLLRKSF